MPDAHDCVLFVPAGAEVDLPGRFSVQGVPYLKRPGRINWLTDRFFLPGRIERSRVDLFHATEITSIPKPGKTPVWATVYDLIPLVYWERTRRNAPWDFVQALKLGYRRLVGANRLITSSEHSKNDICQMLQVDEAKVDVIPLACDESFQPVDPSAARSALRRSHGLEGRFVFYVGGTDFRKNLPWLVRAFARIRSGGYPGRLVMAGETFLWDIGEVREIRREVVRLGLEDAVVFRGYVPDRQLPLFYSACDCFVFPSLYEGFGVPVLEALQCGAPTLAAHTSSIPEVAADAAEYFNPEDESTLVEAFQRVQADPARRERLRQAGFQQARRFSWRETALRLHRLYSEA